MRGPITATLLAAVVPIVSAGCRNTTAPVAGVSTTPGTLAPVGPGQAPILGPLGGGSTRVTPPATGAYTAPTGYLGTATAPAYPGYTGAGTTANPLAPAPIGSGVQVTGWAETNAQVPQQSAGNPVPRAAPRASSTSDPRSGGMQVIDLTGAPAPPGYQRPLPSTRYQQPALPPQAAPYTAPPAFAPAPPQRTAPTGQPQFAPRPTPESHQALGPSTEPVESTADSSSLMWRRPGNQSF